MQPRLPHAGSRRPAWRRRVSSGAKGRLAGRGGPVACARGRSQAPRAGTHPPRCSRFSLLCFDFPSFPQTLPITSQPEKVNRGLSEVEWGAYLNPLLPLKSA